MKLAFYKANKGTFVDKIINLVTGLYGYSHVEIVFSDGMSFSASQRDGEVRFKKINFDSEKWEFMELNILELDEARLRAQAENLDGCDYDYYGIVLWKALEKQDNEKWWCSEVCAYLLKWEKFRVHPNKMAKHYDLPKQPYKFNFSFMGKY